MLRKEAAEEYAKALKEGQKEYKECIQKAVDPNPAVLDELLSTEASESAVKVGLVNIPVNRIAGTKTAGRVSAFTPSFRPLLEADTEFAAKWISLCADHLSDVGIQQPIECFEYLGKFYVQEGNKRVSVLSHFGAPRIAANVKRILPAMDDSPRMKAYSEFLDFYKLTGMYDVLYTTPGSYHKLLTAIGCGTEAPWTEEDRRSFRASFHYFTEAMESVGAGKELPQPEEALLLWLQMYPFTDLKKLTTQELKKTVTQLWPNLLGASEKEPVVKTEPPEEKSKLVQMFKSVDHLTVAFIHRHSRDTSHWTQAHEAGREYIEKVFGEAVTTLVYENANDPETALELIDRAVEEDADVVFTTDPQLIAPTMKGSVEYPRVRFLNCSLNQPYASVKTYYSRIYEAKFITGAIAGAMSRDGKIGYIGDYPVRGVPAAINAFALGAQLTNPNAKIQLKWSCLPGNATMDFLGQGIRVISNRDTSMDNQLYAAYGTYLADDEGHLRPLSSPQWVWGQFYEQVVRSIMNGNWDEEKTGKIVNLWWGMSSGVIDVTVSPELPDGVRLLANLLKTELREGRLDPFARKILDQQGNIRNDGTVTFTPVELMNMDWLCENVEGSLPTFDQVLPRAKPMMELLGFQPCVKEGEGL